MSNKPATGSCVGELRVFSTLCNRVAQHRRLAHFATDVPRCCTNGTTNRRNRGLTKTLAHALVSIEGSGGSAGWVRCYAIRSTEKLKENSQCINEKHKTGDITYKFCVMPETVYYTSGVLGVLWLELRHDTNAQAK